MTPARAALLGLVTSEVARVARVDAATVRSWRTGRRSPDLPTRIVLAAEFGIQITDWEECHLDTPKDAMLLIVRKALADRIRTLGADPAQLLASALDELEGRKAPT